jgi:hypothetical protein
MRLNEQKCKIMHIGTINPRLPYTISTLTDTYVPMIKTDVEKDLGVYLSSDLKWKNQVMYAANKANQILGMLKRTFTYFDVNLV